MQKISKTIEKTNNSDIKSVTAGHPKTSNLWKPKEQSENIITQQAEIIE